MGILSKLLIGGAALVPMVALAEAHTYHVTVENLTKGQVLSPPLIITSMECPVAASVHLGEAASPELQALAEEGISAPLANWIMRQIPVLEVANPQMTVEPNEPIKPGMSKDFVLVGGDGYNIVAVGAMLADTNDGFFFESTELPQNSKTIVVKQAYDAGTERNSELCKFIPGPPCMSSLKHDPAMAEGKVQKHMGIRGVGDLDAATYNWSDIARITITRQ